MLAYYNYLSAVVVAVIVVVVIGGVMRMNEFNKRTIEIELKNGSDHSFI